MKKQPQLGNVVFVLIVVALAGMILAWFTPLIRAFRDEALLIIDPGAVFGRLVLIGLMPIMWIAWVILSIFAINFAVQAGGGEI